MADLPLSTRLRRLAGGVFDRIRPPRPGEAVVSFSARDAKGVPLDLRLAHFLDRRGGFFIEAGANDGLFQSNTALLERSLDWEGILIEPAPSSCVRCRANRRALVHNCGLVSFDYEGDTVTGDFDGYPMGSVGGTRLDRGGSVTVPARTLQSLLDEHGVSHVDFLSLDAEGYELEILRGCDFERTKFDYILSELGPDNFDATLALLDAHGYEHIANYSGYNERDNPEWDGRHNDHLFQRRALTRA
ncbi:MAG TPA: FkbM family methyltransferase [Solirubrobacteraceae bacterium]|jgi:FkbM family methyltransferase